MIIEVTGGMGDDVAATAIVREYKRQRPAEIVQVVSARPEIWRFNPYVNWGSTLGAGDQVNLRMDSTSRSGGNAAHRHAQKLGIQIADDTPEIFLTVPEREACEVPRPGKLIGIDVGTGWESKRWPYERWYQVVEALRAEGWDVVELGGKRNRVKGEEGRPLPATFSLFDKCSIRETAAWLSHCTLFLGHDSGLMHLAAAVGTPQVIVFGLTKWYEYAYYNATPVFPYSDCGQSCYRSCTRPPNVKGRFSHCLDEVSVDRVVDAARVALKRWPFRPVLSRPETRTHRPERDLQELVCGNCKADYRP